jgi:CheY-like chemotaxis protein
MESALKSPSVQSTSGAGLRILVADDNADAAETMAVLLELMGHRVQHVLDGESAVQAAVEFHPDVVLLDIGMPRLNGYEACREIRSRAGGTAMKIIAITGWGQQEDRLKSKDAGFDHHLVKPVDPQTLTSLLQDLTA